MLKDPVKESDKEEFEKMMNSQGDKLLDVSIQTMIV
jgi:hypothetical protein